MKKLAKRAAAGVAEWWKRPRVVSRDTYNREFLKIIMAEMKGISPDSKNADVVSERIIKGLKGRSIEMVADNSLSRAGIADPETRAKAHKLISNICKRQTQINETRKLGAHSDVYVTDPVVIRESEALIELMGRKKAKMVAKSMTKNYNRINAVGNKLFE